MKRTVFYAIAFLLSFLTEYVYPQDIQTEERKGAVTYKSVQHIYTGFKDTEGIIAGDTLFSIKGNERIPSVIVKYISAHSCAGPAIKGNEPAIGDTLTVSVKKQILKSESGFASGGENKLPSVQIASGTSADEPAAASKKRLYSGMGVFHGRFSVQSYYGYSDQPGSSEFQRWRYSISAEGRNLLNGDLYLSSYLTFSYNKKDWNRVRNNLAGSIRVYDLSLKYNITGSTQIQAGRYINPRISSIGSIDGIQIEKSLGKFFFGAAAGSRPDYADYGYNLKLFEAGFYAGRSDTVNSGIMNTTAAFFNQTNNSRTDRRFLYFQHDNNIIPGLNLFASSEVDLFKIENGIGKNSPALTSIYLLSRYALFPEVSLSLSYDARKNVIYYETFRSYYDSLFDNSMRQGLRGGISIRPFRSMYVNLDAGYRTEKGGVKPSRNYSGLVSYTGIPYADLDVSLNAALLEGSYLNAKMYGAGVSRSFFEGSLNTSAGYRRAEYSYLNFSSSVFQDIYSLELSVLLPGNLFLTGSYEGINENAGSSSRLLLELSARF